MNYYIEIANDWRRLATRSGTGSESDIRAAVNDIFGRQGNGLRDYIKGHKDRKIINGKSYLIWDNFFIVKKRFKILLRTTNFEDAYNKLTER